MNEEEFSKLYPELYILLAGYCAAKFKEKACFLDESLVTYFRFEYEEKNIRSCLEQIKLLLKAKPYPGKLIERLINKNQPSIRSKQWLKELKQKLDFV